MKRTLRTLLFLVVVLSTSCKETHETKNKPEPIPAPAHEPQQTVPEKQASEDSVEIDTDKKPLQQPVPAYSWNGKYFGTFLRLEDEAADPRAWGQIKLDIHGKEAVFVIDSYVEILQKDMKVLSQSPHELKLKDPATGKFLTITRTDQLTVEGNLMESIVGKREKYKIEKQ